MELRWKEFITGYVSHFFEIFKKIVRLLYVFILSAPVAVFLPWRGLEVPGSRDRY